MAADSLTPETDVRTRPNPEDESSPSTAPVAPAIATSVIMIEPPAPEALPPPPPVVEPGVPEPRPDEATRVEIVTAPKTSEERAWGLGFFALVTLVFTLATLAALAWNWSYVVRLSGLPAALNRGRGLRFRFPRCPPRFSRRFRWSLSGPWHTGSCSPGTRSPGKRLRSSWGSARGSLG